MLLLYDGKCTVCRNLAQKIHFMSEREVEIRALSTPEAQQVLDDHYPDGWEHDFYVVDDGTARRGARALTRLTGALGVKNMTSVLAEFGYMKLAPKAQASCSGVERSKRNALKVAALSPLLLGFSKLRTDGPFTGDDGVGFSVNVAEVDKLGYGEFRARAYNCPECVGQPKAMQGLSQGAEAHMIEDRMLSDRPFPALAARGDTPTLKVKRVKFEKTTPQNGSLVRSVRSGYTSLFDHPRYGMALNFGRRDDVTSLAGMVHHDLPYTEVDWVVFKTDIDDAASHFRAYAEGLRSLAGLHRRKGQTDMAALYRQMAEALGTLAEPFTDIVGEPLLTNTNELLVTSMPEALRFVSLPAGLKADAAVAAAGCDCSCSCNVCCACGCGIGICITNIPCFCDCCISCGCGCGCCLF